MTTSLARFSRRTCSFQARRLLHGVAWIAALVMAASSLSCRRLEQPTPAKATRSAEHLNVFQAVPIGAPLGEHPPWIGHLTTVDLDGDGLLDLVGCESQENTILWLRQTTSNTFEEVVIARDLKAPVRVEPADVDADGDVDLLVSLMGYIFPNNDLIGSLVVLENDGHQNFQPHVVLENVARVTDARAADLNGDGLIDLIVAQFGYDQGEVRWMERTGTWEFRSHILLELSGAMNVVVADFNSDGRPDIVAQISQQWEEIYLFENRGGGRFERKRLWGSSNEDYGSSGLSLCDLNRDGRPDLLFANGDGFGPAVLPGPRPWHGLQWLENLGNGLFRYRRIGDMAGAYSPIEADLDGDGFMDVVAVAAFVSRDNQERHLPSVMWFRNDGKLNFEPRALAYSPKDQVTLAVGDFDGSGRPWLVTGGFYVFPPYRDLSRITLWRR